MCSYLDTAAVIFVSLSKNKGNLKRNSGVLPTKNGSKMLPKPEGKSMRSYDDPRTPAQRIKHTGVMLEPQRQHTDEFYTSLDLAGLRNQSNNSQK